MYVLQSCRKHLFTCPYLSASAENLIVVYHSSVHLPIRQKYLSQRLRFFVRYTIITGFFKHTILAPRQSSPPGVWSGIRLHRRLPHCGFSTALFIFHYEFSLTFARFLLVSKNLRSAKNPRMPRIFCSVPIWFRYGLKYVGNYILSRLNIILRLIVKSSWTLE